MCKPNILAEIKCPPPYKTISPITWFGTISTLRAFRLQVPWRFFSGFTFVLFCFVFRLYAYIESAAFRSIVLRYVGAPIVARVLFFFTLADLEMSRFRSTFCTISAFSLYGEYLAGFSLRHPSGWCLSTLLGSTRFSMLYCRCWTVMY